MTDPIKRNKNLRYYPIEEITQCRIHGRNKIVDGKLPLFFSHSGVELASTGTELWVDIKTDHSVFEPWIALEINGAFIMRRMLEPGEYAVCLYRGMTYRDEKNAFIYRELQPMNDDDDCHVIIKGFYSDGEFRTPAKRDLKLEFVGDSITSGEGTYGNRYDVDWLPMYMSYSRTYAAIIEKELNAEVRVISQGGWGVFSGWDNNRSHNIPSIYDKVCGLANGELNRSLGAQENYDPAEWQPDAVIINLGTNDVSGFDQPPFFDNVTGGFSKLSRNSDGSLNKEDAEMIKKAAEDFLKQIRSLYPNAFILWIYGMLGNELEPFLKEAVSEYGERNGDDNVSYVPLENITAKELGSRGHPGYEGHRKTAALIADHLRNRLKGKKY